MRQGENLDNTGARLLPEGKTGAPLKVTVGDDVLFVCCKGCLRKVEAEPDRYLAQAAALRNGR